MYFYGSWNNTKYVFLARDIYNQLVPAVVSSSRLMKNVLGYNHIYIIIRWNPSGKEKQREDEVFGG